MTQPTAFAFEAELELAPGTDTRAPSGAVTVALCGHWDHDGPCRWPHTSAINTSTTPARLRTVVLADSKTRNEVVTRIENGLRGDARWTVLGCSTDAIHPDERHLADDSAGG
jgi:hypothetical protein